MWIYLFWGFWFSCWWQWRLCNIQAQQTLSQVFSYEIDLYAEYPAELSHPVSLFWFSSFFSLQLFVLEEAVVMRTNKLPLLKALRTLLAESNLITYCHHWATIVPPAFFLLLTFLSVRIQVKDVLIIASVICFEQKFSV